MKNQNKYYIYFHINENNNEIFYVGKGCNNRAYDINGRNNSWIIYTNQNKFRVEIIEDELSEQDAYDKEVYYINKLGLYNLTNIHSGGKINFKSKKREHSTKDGSYISGVFHPYHLPKN